MSIAKNVLEWVERSASIEFGYLVLGLTVLADGYLRALGRSGVTELNAELSLNSLLSGDVLAFFVLAILCLGFLFPAIQLAVRYVGLTLVFRLGPKAVTPNYARKRQEQADHARNFVRASRLRS